MAGWLTALLQYIASTSFLGTLAHNMGEKRTPSQVQHKKRYRDAVLVGLAFARRQG
uniref:Uncharacterized protein n=1 Tax=Arundo donax TaxID=35708 RepID=A0A0A9FM88_ARUDO